MDEISPLISLPFKLGNLISDESVFATCVDISGIELISMTKLPLVPLENRNSSSSGVIIKIGSKFDKSTDDEDNLLSMTRQNESSLRFRNAATNMELKEEDPTALVACPLAGIIDSRYANKNSSRIKKSESWDSFKPDVVEDVQEKCEIKKPKRTYSTSLLEVCDEMKSNNKPNFPLNFPPLWGSTSIIGRRAEMEDSFVALPRFLKIPSEMLRENQLFNSINQELIAHLFGVYDGHGGCQVANYCKERLHLALAEEIGIAKEDFRIENRERNLKEQWLMLFTKCFHRMDNEVGGFPRIDEEDIALQPIAPDSVGSTAVVAIVCSTHIIVANCGDSRAVLYRGKVAVPMSLDHKPNREDECARIESLGGKVINWDGYRVSGVLAVSRSIGDRYLRPYVVADPEIMFVPRTKEDECLILGSDGLWDVMTNEEACDLARRRILIWHKKNGTTTLSKERGKDIDSAAQDAADYLSQLAFQRGSRDNISVIVIDLKAQRKFKKKT